MKTSFSSSNVFEHSNARYLSGTQLADEFVWTNSFDKLISTKNHIVLGSRGSGKTALIKMLSHECLAQLDYPKAKKLINERSFIATYIPLKVEWVNSINSIENAEQSLFKWSLNLSSCARFIDTIRSCLSTMISDNVERAITEKNISEKVSEFWFSKKITKLTDLTSELESVEYKKNIIFNKLKLGISLSEEDKLIGLNFNIDLFQPLIMAISVVKKALDINNDATWCVCIDEAEFLSKEHHKILNTYMRSYNELVFKITTMPYRHHTLETLVGTPVNIGHDFDYLNIDKLGFNSDSQKSKQPVFEDFAEKLFLKRIKGTRLDRDNASLSTMLGNSLLLDIHKDQSSDESTMNYINNYCDEVTIKRANDLLVKDPDLFRSSIARKLKGTLILKEEFQKFKGNAAPSIYSGKSLIVRCSDGNPRRLLRIFNYLFSDKILRDLPFEQLSDKEQGMRLKEFSYSELDSLNFEVDGKKAFELFNSIGRFFKDRLHTDRIGTTTFNSFKFDLADDECWNCIEKAVDLGLIYPDFRGVDNDNKMPNRNGRFSFAFCLAPYFFLMPRKGDALSLGMIKRFGSYSSYLRSKNKGNDNVQYKLEFGDIDE